MKRVYDFRKTLRIFAFGPAWLLVGPAVVATTALLYVPIMGPFLSQIEAWSMALILFALVLCSLVSHAGIHLLAARTLNSKTPTRIPIHIFGDSAHVWPAARTPLRDVAGTLAGPVWNIILGILFYLMWERQFHPYVDVGVMFLSIYNFAIACVNIMPGFPVDGGRLTRTFVWGIVKRPHDAPRVARWCGWAFVLLAGAWGVFLIIQRARFGLETGAGTLAAVALLAWSLLRVPAWQWDSPPLQTRPSSAAMLGRVGLTGMLILTMFVIAVGWLPVVNGIEAPGSALAVEPMIDVAPAYRQPHSGNFYLTTVITQTPILLAQLVYGHLSPVIKVIPPDEVLPADTSPQQFMRQNYQMLEDSQTAARIVALERAGYDVEIIGQGVEVLGIVPESGANGILQPGDLIVELNGTRVRTVDELIEQVSARSPNQDVHLLVKRDDRETSLLVPLMAPDEPDATPRIGISVRTVGTDVVLPFPVAIHPQKIVGGPSAGLMFTLTIYNLITPEDLTRGRSIAGTGTIDLDGNVGPIGGVEQKVAASEGAGAEYFLAPPENYADAKRVARTITVVEISSVDEAIEFLRSLPPPASGK